MLISVPNAGGIAGHGRASSVFVCRRNRVGGGDPRNTSSRGCLTLILQDLSELLLHLGIVENSVGATSSATSRGSRYG